MTQVFLSLGGNLGDPLSCIKKAIDLIARDKAIERVKISHFYGTSPVHANTPLWFVNAVCSFHTNLAPVEIFEMLQNIEIQLGKVSKAKNESRAIDIDILFYGNQMFKKNELVIPHPRWKERLFVLIPLSDLTSEVEIIGPGIHEHLKLSDLIAIATRSDQSVYLLEKNPDIQ